MKIKKPDPSFKANDEVDRLFTYAKSRAASDPDASRNAVEMACAVARRVRLRLSKERKRLYCAKCFTYFVAGKTCTVRVDKGRVAYHCLHCTAITKYPYLKEQKAKRARKS